MFKKVLITVMAIMMIGCISSSSKIKLTDQKGNSVTLSEDGVELDVQSIERNGIVVEVIEDAKDTE